MTNIRDPHKSLNRRSLKLRWANVLESKGLQPVESSKEISRDKLNIEAKQSAWKLAGKKVIEPVLNRRGKLNAPAGTTLRRDAKADAVVNVEGLSVYHRKPKDWIKGGRFVALVTADSTHLNESETEAYDYREQE